jgi:hypothetical protein
MGKQVLAFTDRSKTKEKLLSMAQGRNIASALDIAPWFPRLKCMLLRHTQLMIRMKAILIGTSILFLTIKL